MEKAPSEELSLGEGMEQTPTPDGDLATMVIGGEEVPHTRVQSESDCATTTGNTVVASTSTLMDHHKDNNARTRELVQSSLELLQESQAATSQSKKHLHRYQFPGSSPSIPLCQVEQLLQSILAGNAESMRSVLSHVLDEQRRLSEQSSPTTCTSTSATAQCTMSVSSGDFYQNEDHDDDGNENESDGMYLNYNERQGEQDSDKNGDISSPDSHDETMTRNREEGDGGSGSVDESVDSEGEHWIVSPTSGTRQTKEHVLGRLSRKSGGTTGVVLEMGDCDLGQLTEVESSTHTRKQIPPPPPPPLSVPPPPSPKDASSPGEDSFESEEGPTETAGDGQESDNDEEEEFEEEEDDGADASREGFSVMKFLCHDLLDADQHEDIDPTPPPPEMSAMALFMPFPHLHLEEFEHFSNEVNNSWSPLRRRRDSCDEKEDDGENEHAPDEEDEDIELGYSKWRFTQDEIEVIEEEYDWYKQCYKAQEEQGQVQSSTSSTGRGSSLDKTTKESLSETSIAHDDCLLNAAHEDSSEDMFLFESEHLHLTSLHELDTNGGESDEDAFVSSTITPLDHLSIMSGEDSDDEDASAPGAGLQLYKLGCSHRELARSFSDDDEDEDDDEDAEGLNDEDLQNLSVDYSKDMEDALSMLQSMSIPSDTNSVAKSSSSDQMLGPRVAEEDESGHGPDDVYVEFALPVVYEPHKTGLEPSPNLTLVEGSMVAGRYHVVAELGSAAFSTAYHCVDTKVSDQDQNGQGADVCLKVIQNSKDFLDQSLDEIKVLQTIQHGTNRGGFASTTTSELCDENHVLHLQRYFYYREHLILVTELLQDNLYEFDKTLREAGQPRYFTLSRLCYVTKQVLLALDYVHSLDLIHCDVKPENIMMWSYRSARVKLIDFGSACYSSDRLSSYIQSRSYRAPEVVLGLPYSSKIDIWSLGGVIAEMFTGQVLFQNESVIGMLARMEAMCGPFPPYMKESGKKSSVFFLPSGLICERIRLRDEEEADAKANTKKLDRRRMTKQESERLLRKYQAYDVYRPKRTSLKERLGLAGPCDESELLFVDFMKQMLSLDPEERPSAREALNHPWIQQWGAGLNEKDLKYRPKVAGFS
jgi:serine/threonine protein kinase